MNAVYLEMVKLGKRWQQELKSNPDAITYILLGHKPENQLFETYFKYQLSDESKTDDTYMIYYQPFDNKNTYGKSLLKELKEIYNEWQKESSSTAEWNCENSDITSDANVYITSLTGLANSYPQLKKNRIFIHLAPTAINNRKDFEEWVIECGIAIEKNGASSYLKLVFTDHLSHRTIKNFYKPHYWKFPIDIANLMDKTAEGTNRRKGAKENNFQQLILKAGNLFGKQQFADADILLTQAIQVSVQNRFTQGIVLAKLLKAQGRQAVSAHDEAEHLYLQAIEHAKGNNDLLTQVYFAYGSFLLSQKEKNKAIGIFEKVVKIGEEKKDRVLQIEANRLIGQVHDTAKFSTSSIPYYEHCIEIGKTTGPEMLRETSIPYIATLLIKKYGTGSEKSLVLNNNMIEWFGEEWMQLATVPDLKKLKKG